MATYTNDEKPLNPTSATWAGALVTYANETRTWAEYAIYSTYTNDTKPS